MGRGSQGNTCDASGSACEIRARALVGSNPTTSTLALPLTRRVELPMLPIRERSPRSWFRYARSRGAIALRLPFSAPPRLFAAASSRRRFISPPLHLAAASSRRRFISPPLHHGVLEDGRERAAEAGKPVLAVEPAALIH